MMDVKSLPKLSKLPGYAKAEAALKTEPPDHGWIWTCPECDHENKSGPIPHRQPCGECGSVFQEPTDEQKEIMKVYG